MEENQLSEYFKNAEIIQQTAQQTQKDFGMLNFEILFSGNQETAYQELFVQIQTIVCKLLQQNYQQLMDVLYRIDVSEKKISETLKNLDAKTLPDIITALILNRELQKVIIRNTYSLK
ncbi:MAG: hypothetical protein ABI199_06715 [Bacteroidia bacterium]